MLAAKPAVLDRIELIDIAALHRRDVTAGAEIFGADVGIRVEELDVAPLPPAALVAPIGLPIRQLLAETLEAATEPRGIDACRRAPRAFHADPQRLGRPKV